VNAPGGNVLRGESPRGAPRGDEVGFGDEVHDAPVHLLRPRIVLVEGSETRLDVADPDAVVEGAERTRHGRRRVALDQHPVGLLLLEDRAQPVDHCDGHVVQVCACCMTLRSLSGSILNRSSIWSSISRCCPVTQIRDERLRAPLELLDDGRAGWPPGVC
jgi:hypothetical protein